MKKLFFLLMLLAATRTVDAAPHRKKATSPFTPLQLKDKIVFTRGNPAVLFMVPGSEVVWTMNPDGSGQKSVWRVPKGYGRFGGFNSSGTQALSYNDFNVYLHDLRTRRLRRLFVHSAGWGTFINSTSFSRDGKRVVFVAGGARSIITTRVCVIDPQHPPRTIEESDKIGLESPPETRADIHEPRFSSDGRRLVVSIGTRYYTNPEFFAGPWNIWTLNVDGSKPRRVTSNTAPPKELNTYDKVPCFNPDERQIAFVRRVFLKNKGEINDIFLVDTDGQNEHHVTNYEKVAQNADKKEFKSRPYNRVRLYNQISDLFFSSDGKQIAFNQTGREDGIYRVDKDGKNLKRLTTGTLVQWAW